MNVLKALASSVSMCRLQVIFLSKITSRYFTNEISRPFNARRESMRKVDCPSLLFIDFYIPELTPGHL
jgi:hypothetical protein